MAKKYLHESVVHDWVSGLTFQQQALLLTIMRGPDDSVKHNSAKCFVRYIRGLVLKPAGNYTTERIEVNDNDFMWGDYKEGYEGSDGMITHFDLTVKQFWGDHDHYPHHFIMHLVHCAEVIGYKYPSPEIRVAWNRFYLEACKAFHMNPETESEMDARLNDFETGIHNDPDSGKQNEAMFNGRLLRMAFSDFCFDHTELAKEFKTKTANDFFNYLLKLEK